MLALEMLADQLPIPLTEPLEVPVLCAITGRQTRHAVPRKKLVWGKLRAPQSGFIDARIAEALSGQKLQLSSWVMSSGGIELKVKKKRIREAILTQSLACPFGIYAAPDMRRQGGLLTPLNRSWDMSVVQFGLASCDAGKVREWYPRILEKFSHGVSRKDLVSPSNFAPFRIEEFDITGWMAFLMWAADKAMTPEYALSVWLLPTKEEQENAK